MRDFSVNQLTKSVGDKTVFKDISFIIHQQDRIGVIGVNGTGKTTLLDVIAGKIGYDGDVSPLNKANDYRIAYLRQEPDFDEKKTILETVLSDDIPEMRLLRDYESLMLSYTDDKQDTLEAIMAEMDRLDVWSVENEVKTVLSKLGITDLRLTISQLSGGLKRRVQLAQTLLADADLLLLDEPTNHLDIGTISWLSQYLKTSKKTVLFITHDRYFLDHLANRIFELADGSLTEYQGNYQDYVRLRAEQDERDAANLHKKKQLYQKELAWMRTQPQARATKQQARIDRFQNLKADLAETRSTESLAVSFEASRIGKKVLAFEGVDFSYGNKPILSDFNLLVQNRDRIGIIGDNGIGKSTLLKLINKELEPQKGRVVLGETVKVAHFSQHIQDMDDDKRVINYLQEVAEEVLVEGNRISITELLEQFLFPRSSHGTLIKKLSGGEKKRLYLLKLLLQKPNLLLLDEPTNDLDIATLTVLEEFLNQFAGPVITVSHDRYFLDKVAKKLLIFTDGNSALFYGNYTDYLDEQAFLAEKNQDQITKKRSQKTSDKVKTKKKRLSYFEKKEWETIETKITDLEEAIGRIEIEMTKQVDNYQELAKLQEKLDQANSDLLEQYERYDYLSDLAD